MYVVYHCFLTRHSLFSARKFKPALSFQLKNPAGLLSYQFKLQYTNHCDIWKNHRVENANRLIKQVKLCLINIYKADWSNKARNSIKLRTYIKFKFDHSLEEYLFLHPRHKVDKGAIKIENELTYARNWTRKACQAAKNTTRTAHMSKMYIKHVKLCC